MPHNYTYHLDRTSHKAVCPHCGRKTFVLYLDAAGRQVDPSVGKCDRRDHCGYHLSPSAWRKANGINRSPSMSLRSSSAYKSPAIIKSRVVPSYLDPYRYVDPTLGKYDGSNALLDWLYHLFRVDRGDIISHEDFHDVLSDYLVGTARRWDGATIWWQVDPKARVHTGKIMAYDRSTGKRVKHGSRPLMQWAHSLLADRLPGNFNMVQTYYGAHRLTRNPGASIWLMESEKAALIIALCLKAVGGYNVFLPMACGGCDGLNTSIAHRLDPCDRVGLLKGRRVTLMPDAGKYTAWKAKGDLLRGYCEHVSVSTLTIPAMRRPHLRLDTRLGDGPDDPIIAHLLSPHATRESLADIVMLL